MKARGCLSCSNAPPSLLPLASTCNTHGLQFWLFERLCHAVRITPRLRLLQCQFGERLHNFCKVWCEAKQIVARTRKMLEPVDVFRWVHHGLTTIMMRRNSITIARRCPIQVTCLTVNWNFLGFTIAFTSRQRNIKSHRFMACSFTAPPHPLLPKIMRRRSQGEGRGA